MKVLVLKDIYNSFEQYYLNEFNRIGVNAEFYYTSNSRLRKLWTHYGLPLENVWYGKWKRCLSKYELVIVFDSIHTSKILHYIRKRTKSRIVYWHWNPIQTEEDLKIYNETSLICEHWTFNPADATKYGMMLNNQFFFFQDNNITTKKMKAFFVGTDKGRYQKLLKVAAMLEQAKIEVDFRIIDKEKTDKFYQKEYLEYSTVLDEISESQFLVEIVQDGQSGLTARSLEAMFFQSKLITNNVTIKEYSFYNPDNIFILGKDDNFAGFINTPFSPIEKEKLVRFSGQGWIESFFSSF